MSTDKPTTGHESEEPIILSFEAAKEAAKPTTMMQEDVRKALALALDPANESPVNKRLRKLQAAIDSGEVTEVVGREWVLQCYNWYRMREEEAYIRKSDAGSRAIVLSLAEMEDLGALAYITNTGEEMVIDADSAIDGDVEYLLILPSELGD